MSDSDLKETKPEEEQAGQVRDGALRALRGSDRLTPREQEEIASTIETEVTKLLPDLPEGIAEIAFKALGLSLSAADKLLDQQEHPPRDERPSGDE